jgi:hypothetical protein
MREVLPNLPPMPVWVLYPQNRLLSQRVRVFVDWLTEVFAAAPYQAKPKRYTAPIRSSCVGRLLHEMTDERAIATSELPVRRHPRRSRRRSSARGRDLERGNGSRAPAAGPRPPGRKCAWGLQGGALVAIRAWTPWAIDIDDRVIGEIRRQQELIRSRVDQE